MNRQSIVSGIAGAALGGIAFTAVPAFADAPVFDWTVNGAIVAMSSAMSTAFTHLENSATSALTDLTNPASLGTLLTNGFTQMSNYTKAGVAAQAQITDASNTSMAMFDRNMRNAQLRDEQTPSAQACLSVDGGQVVTAAALQGWRSTSGIEMITDNRGEGQPGTPAYMGAGQASAAAGQAHMKRYCSLVEAEAGLCTVGKLPDADQRSASIFGSDNLVDQDGLNAANDFAATIIQPVPPATIRGDQLTSVSGQDAYARRRAYNGRMSLARGVFSYLIGIQSPGVTLTANQKQELTSQGITVPDSGSWLQTVSLEVNRRVGDLAWATGLQQMPPASVMREIATEQALTNYLLMQNYRVAMRQAALSATQVAQWEEEHAEPTTMMPTPGMASN